MAIMGMTEQAAHMRALHDRASDKQIALTERMLAWCEWGRMQKDTHNMATALREISHLLQQL